MLTPTRFRALAAVTALLAFLQITLGGLVRVSGSGLGCPDWPTCYGRPYPPADLHAVIEYSHRTVGALTGLLIIATMLAAFWLYRGRRSVVTWLAAGTLATVIAEGLLGWRVVATLLNPVLVLVHLALALLILALMIGIGLLALPAGRRQPTGSAGRLGTACVALTFVMLLTGSAVVAARADVVCNAWPLCAGGFSFDFSGPAAYAMLHRLTVLAVSILLIHYLSLAWRRFREVPGARPAAGATLVALLAQILVGALAAVTHEVALVQGLHVALGTAVWAGVLTLTVLLLRASEPAASPALALERNAAT